MHSTHPALRGAVDHHALQGVFALGRIRVAWLNSLRDERCAGEFSKPS
jgi:hypothetical protein